MNPNVPYLKTERTHEQVDRCPRFLYSLSGYFHFQFLFLQSSHVTGRYKTMRYADGARQNEMLFLCVVFDHCGHWALHSSCVRQISHRMLIELNAQSWFEGKNLRKLRKIDPIDPTRNLLPTSPGTMPLCLKFSVAPPLQNIRSVNVREPLMPTDGPLPAPISIANHPLLINRRPDITKFPAPFPFCDDKLPDMETVSLVVIGASIDCDMDIPDTSILGNGIGPSSL